MTSKNYHGAPFDDNPYYEEFNRQGPHIEAFTRPNYTDEEIYGNFSSNVKSLRTAMGLSQKELADKLKTNIETVINWEDRKELPAYTILADIAHLFRTTVHVILTERIS